MPRTLKDRPGALCSLTYLNRLKLSVCNVVAKCFTAAKFVLYFLLVIVCETSLSEDVWHSRMNFGLAKGNKHYSCQ